MSTTEHGPAGQELAASILADLTADGLEPDAREATLIDTAASLADRMADLDRLVTTDGERSVSDSGLVRLHPGIAEYRQHAVALAKVLSAIALDETSAAKDPDKVRAAQTRWRAHNIAKTRAAQGA